MNLNELSASLHGSMILPGHAAYDDARSVWNGMIDRRPAAIVRAAGVADVIGAIRCARAQKLPLAVRGGGHNVAGNSTCEGGIVLDLSPMKMIRVDPQSRTARAGAGALWRDFDHETQAFGLATPGGLISSTGLAGLTLGGGFGYLSRQFGMSCDNLISADVVTADGKLVIASENENADLFWGLRGGGGNFGVVTSFEYRLHPVGPVYGGLIAFPGGYAAEMLKRYREVTASAPETLVIYAGLQPSPTGGTMAALVVAYFGSEEEGSRLLKPLRETGPAMFDTLAVISYCQLQQMLDAFYPKGQRNYWKTTYLTGLPDELNEMLIAARANAPSPLDQILIEQIGGAVSLVPRDATAFEHRDAEYNLMAVSISTDPEHKHAQMAWARKVWQDARPYSTGGAYVNYLDADETARAAYSSDAYQRLAALKKKYDPENVFRLNQNIQPA